MRTHGVPSSAKCTHHARPFCWSGNVRLVEPLPDQLESRPPAVVKRNSLKIVSDDSSYCSGLLRSTSQTRSARPDVSAEICTYWWSPQSTDVIPSPENDRSTAPDG